MHHGILVCVWISLWTLGSASAHADLAPIGTGTIPATIVPTGPQSLAVQSRYNFDAYVGDFDSNGYTDVYLRRRNPGRIDGSLQSVMLKQAAGEVITAVIPTAQEISTAKANPVSTTVTTDGTDLNFDGFADRVIMGLSAAMGLTTDEYIVYAPGVDGVAAPLGVTAMDEEFMSFFGNLDNWLKDPSWFLDT